MQAVVVGGGIAGPAVACGLAAGGATVRLLEARDQDERGGAFLVLAPNGVNALAALGLRDVVERSAALPVDGITFRNGAGRVVGRVDGSREQARFGACSHLVVRNELHRSLREAAAAAGVLTSYGTKVADLVAAGLSATVRTEDGRDLSADLVIGADGVGSSVRRAMFGTSPSPRWAGMLDTGGTAAVDLADTSGQQMVFGRRGFFGYVVRSGTAYWFSNLPRAAEPSRAELAATPPERWLDILRDQQCDDPAPVPAILAAATASGLAGLWPVRDLPPLPAWHRGRVCLIGDAAHATSPSAGQGASLALEDAAVLVRCLATHDRPAHAFATFEQLRKARADRIVRLGRRLGSPKAPSPAGVWVRDLMLPLFLRAGARDTLRNHAYRAGDVDVTGIGGTGLRSMGDLGAVSRRGLLIAGAATAGAVVVGTPVAAGGAAALVWTRAVVTDVDGPAGRALAVPQLDTGDMRDGRRVFALRLQEGVTDLGGAQPTATWGVNGGYLGPTLRLRRGEHVQVDVTNDVDETTTIHWHGMHLPARMDGGPHQPIDPGQTWRPDWVVAQPAATLWYHPHPHGTSHQHVYRGLAGMIIVDDEDTDGLDLPSTYGVDDLPVVLTDVTLDGNGQLDEGTRMWSNLGIVGQTVLANGTPDAYYDVSTERVRLRLLNASGTRTYGLVVADTNGDHQPFDLIGTDSGLLPRPSRVEQVDLSPGERAEVVVTMTPGLVATLRSVPVDLGTDPWNARMAGAHDHLDILQLCAADQLTPSPQTPTRLGGPVDVPVDPSTPIRRFELLGVQINGRTMDHSRIDEVVDADSTEIWEVTNADGAPHNFHVHDVRFTVLDTNQASNPTHVGWKDTVYVPPGTTLRLAIRFGTYTDPTVPYMFHCHLLLHENQGMMGQFLVVEPGTAPATPTAGGHHQ